VLEGWEGSLLIGLFCDRISGCSRRMGQEGTAKEKSEENKRALQILQGLPTRQPVAFSDLTRVQANYEQLFCLFGKLTDKEY
jgi:hypothetical protein